MDDVSCRFFLLGGGGDFLVVLMIEGRGAWRLVRQEREGWGGDEQKQIPDHGPDGLNRGTGFPRNTATIDLRIQRDAVCTQWNQ